LRACCVKFEALVNAAESVTQLRKPNPITEELIDYIELTLYAAVEHVDDVKSIVLCCFRTKAEADKSRLARKLNTEIKKVRDRLPAIDNAMKHHQARIRLFSVDFMHAAHKQCLHGLFVEGFSKGAVGPSPIIHRGVERVISVPAFLWEVCVYFIEMSEALASF